MSASSRWPAILGAALLLVLAGCAPVPTPAGGTQPSASATTLTSPRPAPSPVAAGADVCHPASGAVLCVLNPAVSPATMASTICKSGWTATVRPPAKYTDDLKRQQLQQFAVQHPGDPQWNVAGTEEDHRLPLDLGGAPRDVMNLSPEAHRQSTLKDQDESRLGGSQGEVCRGLQTLAQAQQELAARWLVAWPGYAA